ncbi:MAG: tetrahydrofolate dehydrogenase/cyclohydrolase catalytic domain-containing protein [Metamycoplasmataceae bacterium]
MIYDSKILDGKKLSIHLLSLLKDEILKNNFKPSFCIIQIGDLFESNKYINFKLQRAKEIGIQTNHIKLSEDISFIEIKNIINQIKSNHDGIIIQLPLPISLPKQEILDLIPIEKDIDGLSTQNKKNFQMNISPYFVPATAKAILNCLKYNNIPILNKKISIVGESDLVGKPTKILLERMGLNVNSFNKDTGITGTEKADILIVAAGEPKLIKKENVQKNACIIDVGINTLDNHSVIGDVDFDDVIDKIKFISPSPGGIGPLTIISLLENLIIAYRNQNLK